MIFNFCTTNSLQPPAVGRGRRQGSEQQDGFIWSTNLGVPFLNHGKRKIISDLAGAFQSPVINMLILKWSWFVTDMLFSDKLTHRWCYVSVYDTVNMTDQSMQLLQREEFLC